MSRRKRRELNNEASEVLKGLFSESRKPFQPEIWIATVVAYNPNPDALLANVVQKMIGEPVEIAATKPASVKAEKPGVFNRFPEPDFKFLQEICPKLQRSLAILSEDLI